MAHRRSGTERIIAELPTVCWRFRFSIFRRGFICPGAFLFPPFLRQRQPPQRRPLFLLKTAPFSSSVAFLTPPTFPAPAPRKRFFDPLPKKILGSRTRKGRLPRRQYLARARLEFRAGLRVVVSSRARAFGISCGLLAGRSGGGGLALCCACGPARHGISARPCAFGISCACPAGGAGGWLADLLAAGAGRRPADRLPAAADKPTAAPIEAARPDRLPPVDDLPP